MMSGGHQVTNETDRLSARPHQDGLMRPRVSGRHDRMHAGADFHVAVDKREHAGALQWQQVRSGIIAPNRLPVGAQGVFPLLSLHRVKGVLKRRFISVFRLNRGPACMVHVQVGKHHPVHLVRRHARFSQRVDHAPGWVRSVYVPVFPGQLRRADAGFHQHRLRSRFHQQAVQPHPNPVPLVGRYFLFPDRPGDHAEHCAPVELEPPGVQRRDANFPDVP